MILSQFSLLFNDTQNFRGEVKQNESLAKHCTMRVGGEAKLYIEPFDTESLIFALKSAREAGLDFYLLGGGSNTIFPDEGMNLVICTKKIGFEEPAPLVHLLENSGAGGEMRIVCSAGASWGSVLGFCRKNNLGGFEPFTALSGTVGGAVFMNASCFGLSLSDNLSRVEYLDYNPDFNPDSKQLEIKNYELKIDDWGYKRSPFQNCKVQNYELQNREEKRRGGVAGDLPPLEGAAENAQAELCEAGAVGARGRLSPLRKKIVLSAEFKVKDGFDAELSEQVRQKRVSMGHFRAASAGSAFKNEPEKGIVAGKLIDECGLKGFSAGGAQIAPWHANFIINPDGKATAADIRALVEAVRKKVFEEKGVLLEPEIIFA